MKLEFLLEGMNDEKADLFRKCDMCNNNNKNLHIGEFM